MSLRILLALCAALALALLPQRADAATTCSATSSNIVISGYDGSAAASANSTVTIRCNSSNAVPFFSPYGGEVRVRLCLYIGNTPRELTGPSNNKLSYSLQTASGNWQGPPAHQVVTLSYTVSSWWAGGTGSGQTTVPITALILPQAVYSAGTYLQALTATATDYRYDEPDWYGASGWPTSCNTGSDGGGNATFPFSVSANVAGSCRIDSTQLLDFGEVDGFITAPVDQISQIALTCVGGTAWRAGLGNGLHASGTTRRMADGSGNFVTYELYRDAARGQRWGNTPGVDRVTGTGTGSNQGLTVYGRVPTQTATPGNYRDTVTVEIHY